jgi:putative peptide zinc metalloprotease protein
MRATPRVDQGARPESAVSVPPRPRLPQHVRLVGELQGTGFADRQWLIRRGQGYIQVTELLYRIAEHADGSRSIEEIAAGVTETTRWRVTEEDIVHVLRTKLIPLGLIEDGIRPGPSGVQTLREEVRSPLAVNLRVKSIGPDAIDRAARILQHLFSPIAVVPLLVLIVTAHVWVYRYGGLMGAVVDALYRPHSLLVLILLLFLAALVHEFGHASALRYGGQRARGMGMGFYLVFPAFYTDVTESYRLNRWQRVRVGLGGVYFHALFAVLLVGISLAFRLEFLLLVVVLIDLEIARQLIPFVRLDGYWVLADLTGIPDFFSQMAPFVRRLIPGRGRGTRLPRLKPWVHAVFVTYISLTVPFLVFLLVVLFRRLPRIMTVLWDALRTQAGFVALSYGEGDILGVATSLLQILILALSALGVGYFVSTVTWKAVRAAWRQPWGSRRVFAISAVSAALALVASMWAPELPFGSRVPPSGVRTYEITDRLHTEDPVAYAQRPPVGGRHAPTWQNCGFYDAPVRDVNAVHSLEHGAVWIAFRRDLEATQVERLRELASTQTHILVSPMRDLPAPVVASAWGKQLRVDSILDARLQRFIQAFRLGDQAPEAGGPCEGGTGEPLAEPGL